MIGKMLILSFSDAEDYIIDKLKTIIKDENIVEYVEIVPKTVLSFKNLEIYLKEQEAYRDGKLIPLSKQEFLVLKLLADHHGWVCTKEEIYNAICGDEIVGDINNSIYCLIRSLRKKLETDSHNPEYIKTIRGVGYKFVVPGE